MELLRAEKIVKAEMLKSLENIQPDPLQSGWTEILKRQHLGNSSSSPWTGGEMGWGESSTNMGKGGSISEHRNRNPRGVGSELITSQHGNCQRSHRITETWEINQSGNTEIAFLTFFSLRAKGVSKSDATGPCSLGDLPTQQNNPWTAIHFKNPLLLW